MRLSPVEIRTLVGGPKAWYTPPEITKLELLFTFRISEVSEAKLGFGLREMSLMKSCSKLDRMAVRGHSLVSFVSNRPGKMGISVPEHFFKNLSDPNVAQPLPPRFFQDVPFAASASSHSFLSTFAERSLETLSTCQSENTNA